MCSLFWVHSHHILALPLVKKLKFKVVTYGIENNVSHNNLYVVYHLNP
jgi:hypothetical protein